MASDWIKVEKLTPDKPELAILARKLKVSQAEAFLNWFRVYSWADGVVSPNCPGPSGTRCPGFVPAVSPHDIDMMARCHPGTCEALASKDIGWLVEEEGGVRFSNWERHNGKSAKARAYEAEKKRRQRAEEGETVPVLSRTCPETNGTFSGPVECRSVTDTKTLDTVSLGTATLDLSNFEWESIPAECSEVAKSIKPLDKRDRDLIVKAVVLSKTLFDRDWLWTAVKAARRKKTVEQFKYFHGALKGKCADLGQNFNNLLKQIKVPSEFFKVRGEELT